MALSESSFPSSVRLLMAACRADADVAIRAVSMTDSAWATLADDATRHGVSALVAGALDTRPDVPASVRAAMDADAHRNALRALRALSELLRVIETLDNHGVANVALKGPAFSQWLYGRPGIRHFGDLDVLVCSRDRMRALDALQGLGYGLPRGMSVKSASTVYGALGAWPLTGGGTYQLDVHWRLSHIRFPRPLTSLDVIGQAGALDVAGRRIRVPCATHAALLTLLHASKHLWCTLEMIVAIAVLMRREDVDWHAVRSLARSAHGWHGCAAGLQLASQLLGAAVPRALSDGPWPAAADRLCADGIAALRLPAGIFHDRWAERRAHRAAFDRWTDRVKYDVSRIVAPTPLEWQWIRLPDALTSLYVPLRLLRLGTAAVSAVFVRRHRGLTHRMT